MIKSCLHEQRGGAILEIVTSKSLYDGDVYSFLTVMIVFWRLCRNVYSYN